MKHIFLATALITLAAFAPTSVAHISLISPKPLLDGYAENGMAHKRAPFGAPGVDAQAADATTAISGGDIEIEIDMYVFHAGEIVVQYTQDPAGKDVAPAMSLPNTDTPIPYPNILHRMATPCVMGEFGCKRGREGKMTFKTQFALPNVEGDIYLVVRQVMTDRAEELADGTVDLSRVYYHQTAKLHLVKE